MNNLEQKTITSVEVAEMMEVDHYKILEKLEGTKDGKTKGIIPTMTAHEIVVSDYFMISSYKDNSGKENKCYNVTKLGCDFLANKFTGEKGVLFTAKYVKRFHEMEQTIKTGLLEELSPELQAIFSHDKKLQFIVTHINETDSKVESVNKDLQEFKKDMPLLGIELDKIKNARNRKIVPLLGGKNSQAYNDRSLRDRVYKDSANQIWREFGVNSFKEIKRCQCDLVLEIINRYQLPFALKQEIEDCNAQAAFA